MHKQSDGRVSNIQVIDRQAMRLNGCFPKNTMWDSSKQFDYTCMIVLQRFGIILYTN